MNPTPEQLRLCAYLMENPEVRWEYCGIAWSFRLTSKASNLPWITPTDWTPFDALAADREICLLKTNDVERAKYSREGRLLILHNQDCDQFGDITGESPSHLWFSRHGGYFKLSLESGEVETLKPAEF